MLAEYHFGFDELLELSLKRFWFLSNQIDRIRAKRDYRQIQVLASVTSQETYKKADEYLKDQIGQVYVWEPIKPTAEIKIDPVTGLDPEFDRAGLHALREKIAAEDGR